VISAIESLHCIVIATCLCDSLCFLALFLLAKAATALACLSHRNSVQPFFHLGGSVKNAASKYDHQIFIVGCLEDSSFRICKAFP